MRIHNSGACVLYLYKLCDLSGLAAKLEVWYHHWLHCSLYSLGNSARCRFHRSVEVLHWPCLGCCIKASSILLECRRVLPALGRPATCHPARPSQHSRAMRAACWPRHVHRQQQQGHTHDAALLQRLACLTYGSCVRQWSGVQGQVTSTHQRQSCLQQAWACLMTAWARRHAKHWHAPPLPPSATAGSASGCS